MWKSTNERNLPISYDIKEELNCREILAHDTPTFISFGDSHSVTVCLTPSAGLSVSVKIIVFLNTDLAIGGSFADAALQPAESKISAKSSHFLAIVVKARITETNSEKSSLLAGYVEE